MSACGGDGFLQGYEGAGQLEVGCLDAPVCYDLWTCYHTTGCHGGAAGPMGCYCGADADVTACVSGTAPAVGRCKDEMLAAFEAQWGSPPSSVSQLATLFLAGTDGAFTPLTAPYLQANYLQKCMETEAAFRDYLDASADLDETEAQACVDACFQ
jgi:hypothetical protein